MRDERLGSYSIETTVPGTAALSRLKSITRSLRLCPPPRCQMVISPALRRPPMRSLMCVNGLCGLSAVSSSLVSVVLKRNDGVIGLYVLIAIKISLWYLALGLWLCFQAHRLVAKPLNLFSFSK